MPRMALWQTAQSKTEDTRKRRLLAHAKPVSQKKKSCRSIRYDSSFFSKSAQAYAQANFEFALANVGNSRNVSAELERSSLFTTASAESDSNDSGSENDSALHGSISCCVPKFNFGR